MSQPTTRRILTEASLAEGPGAALVGRAIERRAEPRRPAAIDPGRLVASRAIAPQAVPTYDSTGQTVHPSVKYFPEKWNGYHWWMAHTPYPNGVDATENPSVVASNDGESWVTPSGLSNPIDQPAGSVGGMTFFPDPDIVMDGDTMWVVYAQRYAKYSTNGRDWSPRQTLNLTGATTGSYVSPSLFERDGVWHYYAVESTTRKVRIHRSTSGLTGEFVYFGEATMPVPAGRAVWHIEVRPVGDQVIAAVTVSETGSPSAGALHIAASSDGVAFEVAPPILGGGTGATAWDSSNVYRASLVPLTPESGALFACYYSARSGSGEWRIGRTTIHAATHSPGGALPATQRWYGPAGIIPGLVNGAGAGFATATPFYLAAETTFDKIACEVMGIHAGEGSVRLGVYASNSLAQPQYRLLDAGTVAADAVGVKEISISLTLKPGLYWLAGAVQGGTVSLRSTGAQHLAPVASTAFAGTSGTDGMSCYGVTAGMTGTFPESWNPGTARAHGILVKMRAV